MEGERTGPCSVVVCFPFFFGKDVDISVHSDQLSIMPWNLFSSKPVDRSTSEGRAPTDELPSPPQRQGSTI